MGKIAEGFKGEKTIVNAFSRAFRQEMEITPKEYRKKYK
jgi:transcriptional regulator GlxA family with amidase domain